MSYSLKITLASLLLFLTACTKETKQSLSQVELFQQVFGNLVDTTRTVMDGYDEYRAFADSLLYNVAMVKERNIRIGARSIAHEIMSSMLEESEFISAEEVRFFHDSLLNSYFSILNYWHIDTIDQGYYLTYEKLISHPTKTKITEFNMPITHDGVSVIIDFPWDATNNPIIKFYDNDVNEIEGICFDKKSNDIVVYNRNEEQNMRVVLSGEAINAMITYPYMWIEYSSDDPNMGKETQTVQQLIPLWHFQSTIFTLQ